MTSATRREEVRVERAKKTEVSQGGGGAEEVEEEGGEGGGC